MYSIYRPCGALLYTVYCVYRPCGTKKEKVEVERNCHLLFNMNDIITGGTRPHYYRQV